jgi:hypothetical protein
VNGAIVYLLAMALVGGIAAVEGWHKRKVRRALRAAPALDRVLGEGDFVRVTGHVRIEKHFIHAPLSDRRCVAYCARAIPAPRVLRDYPPFEEWKMVSFVIEREDKTRVAIDCAYVKLLLPPLPLRPGSDERCAELGRTRKLAARALKKMQYEEIVVMEDMRISVAGILVKDAQLDPDQAERGYRDAQTFAMRLGGSATRPLIIGVPVD